MQPELLESMCIMGKIEGPEDTNNFTDQIVKTWYKGLKDVDPSDLNARLNEIMKDTTHLPDPKDHARSVVYYVREVMTHIKRLAMGNIMNVERQSTQVISRLVDGLRPIEPKDRMVRERVKSTKDKY